MDVEDTAFNIPLIIKEISSFLPLEDLKRCRLINKECNATLIPEIVKRDAIVLKIPMMTLKDNDGRIYYTLLDCIDESFFKMDSRLVSKLKLHPTHTIITTTQPDSKERAFTVEKFLEIHENRIESLDILVDTEYLQYFTAIFQEFSLSSLNKLTIIEDHCTLAERDRCCDSVWNISFHLPKFPVHPNLKYVKYGLLYKDGNMGIKVARSLACALMHSAETVLEELDIMDNIYPDLRNCTSLKKLTLSYTTENDECYEFDYSSITNILTTVKDHLEELYLTERSSTQETSEYYSAASLTIPVFKNLKVLSLSVELYKIATLDSKHFPILESISLEAAFFSAALEDFIYSLPYDEKLLTVNELKLIVGVQYLHTLIRAVEIFPNIKRHLVVINKENNEDDENEDDDDDDDVPNVNEDANVNENLNGVENQRDGVNEELVQLLKIIGRWKLQKLTLVLKNTWDLFEVFAALSFCTMIEGLEDFKIIVSRTEPDENYLPNGIPDEVKEGVLATRQLKSFEIYQEDLLSQSQVQLLKEITVENDLKWSFIEGKISDDLNDKMFQF